MVWFLSSLLVSNVPLRFADSTMLEVSRNHRADHHKVTKGVTAFGKNWQRWWYGFKLHAAINPKGQLCAIHFTLANEHDNQFMERLVNDQTKNTCW